MIIISDSIVKSDTFINEYKPNSNQRDIITKMGLSYPYQYSYYPYYPSYPPYPTLY